MPGIMHASKITAATGTDMCDMDGWAAQIDELAGLNSNIAPGTKIIVSIELWITSCTCYPLLLRSDPERGWGPAHRSSQVPMAQVCT